MSRVTFDGIIREQSNFSSIRREISPNFDANVTILISVAIIQFVLSIANNIGEKEERRI